MALASQSARTRSLSSRGGYTGSNSRRRSRRNKRIIGGLVVLALGVGIVWMVTRGGDGPTDSTNGTDVASSGGAPEGGAPPFVAVTDNRTNDERRERDVTPRPAEPPTLITGQPAGTETTEPIVGDNNPSGADTEAPIREPLNDTETTDPDPVVPSTTPPGPPALASDIEARLEQAELLTTERRFVQARTVLNDLLHDDRLTSTDRQGIRQWLTDINQTLLFTPQVFAEDPLQSTYQVKSGDYLSTIVKREQLMVDYRLLARVNAVRPERIRVGQTLKVIRGPFHAVVDKSDFRLDVYAGPTPNTPRSGEVIDQMDDAIHPGWVYVRSFPVGLGEYGLTPTGTFRVNGRSRLVNPGWTNPRTNERFKPDDPKNPIGERWLGLVGIDDSTKTTSGMGIHGTVEPDSIGQERSMGCVRLLAPDVELVYELFAGSDSFVYIVE